MPSERPGPSEASDYYFQYINQVPAGDIRETLRAPRETTRTLLRGIDDRVADHRYAAGKWTLREVAGPGACRG